jgi:hypothetical protein
LDSTHYLNNTQSINAELLMLMVAAGVDDWISAAYPEMDFTAVPWASRFRAWLKTEVELEKVALEMGPLGSEFLIAAQRGSRLDIAHMEGEDRRHLVDAIDQRPIRRLRRRAIGQVP